MKFRTTREIFSSTLAKGGVSIKCDPMLESTFRGFGHVKFNDGRLEVISAGPTVSSKSSVSIDDPQSVNGDASFSLEEMQQILKFFPKNDEVLIEKISSDEDKNGHVSIKSGKMKLVLQCINSKMYSNFEEPSSTCDWVEVDTKLLVSSMSRMAPFAVEDAEKIRSHLGFRSSEGNLYIGAGGSRYFGFSNVCECNKDSMFFVPASMSSSIGKFIDGESVKISMSGNKLYILDGKSCIRICLPEKINEKFVNFIILKDRPVESGFVLSSERLSGMLQACNHVNSVEMLVKVRDGAISFIASSSSGAEYKGSMEYASPSSNDIPEYDFAISPSILLSFAKKCSEDVKIEFSNQRTPGKGDRWPAFVALSHGGSKLYMQSSVVSQAKYENS